MKKISIYPNLESRKRQAIREAIAVAQYISKVEDDLPDIERNFIAWNYQCRPFIKGEPNRLKHLPMMLSISKDLHPFIMLLLARQWGKTTHFASVLAHGASTNNNYDQTYINFEQESLKTFSDNKFRKDVFAEHPLSEYIQGFSKFGSMTKVTLKTNSTIDMITALHNWQHAQGKSNKRIVIDEANDIDWTGWYNLRETQADTMGDTLIGGIGGYQDTLYHKLWKTTNQMEYKFDHGEPYKGYDNMSWRRELEKNCFNDNGIVYDDAMDDALAGQWEPQAPKNFSRHGYHLDQLQNPRIPLTIEDAINLYKVPIEFSIEHKLKDPDYTQSEYRRNVLAEFIQGELKPITEPMMIALFDKNLGLTRADDVDKQKYGRVYVGIDWGGGGKTIVWIWQCLDNAGPIFRLLHVERIESSDVEEQYQFCKNLIDAYEADKIVVDAGGGTYQVQQLQQRYGPRCVRLNYLARPEKPQPIRKELIKLRKENRYTIDRTFSIDRIIDLIKRPYIEGDFKSNRIILPGKEFDNIKWVVRQFTAVEGEKAQHKGTGQQYIRYIHKDTEPDDALQACNYAYIAWDIGKSEGTHIGGAIEGESSTSHDGFAFDD